MNVDFINKAILRSFLISDFNKFYPILFKVRLNKQFKIKYVHKVHSFFLGSGNNSLHKFSKLCQPQLIN